MIGISIAAKSEWEAVCEYFGSRLEEREKHPFGGYFKTKLKNEDTDHGI